MADKAPDVNITSPTGKASKVSIALTSPGRFTAHVKAEELGLYRINDGTLNAVAAAGPWVRRKEDA